MVVIHGLVNFCVWQTLSWVRLGSGNCDTDSWVGGSTCMVNAVARRIMVVIHVLVAVHIW
jgi:hypothetical protein